MVFGALNIIFILYVGFDEREVGKINK